MGILLTVSPTCCNRFPTKRCVPKSELLSRTFWARTSTGADVTSLHELVLYIIFIPPCFGPVLMRPKHTAFCVCVCDPRLLDHFLLHHFPQQDETTIPKGLQYLVVSSVAPEKSVTQRWGSS